MTYNEIHKALRDKGYNWRIAAEAIGCSHGHLLNVASSRVESPRVGRAIAVLVGCDVLTVFPHKPHYAENKEKRAELKLEEARLALQNAGMAVAS